MLSTYIQVITLIFFYMSALFTLALVRKDNSIADIGWGMGFILIAYYTLIKTGLYIPRHILITTLITLWALRLSTHILIRNWGKSEDARYAAWRKAWGNVILRSFFQIFMLQGMIMLIIAYPIILINTSNLTGLHILDIIGFVIWLFGFLFETIGDIQLYRFIKNPANTGKIMTQGLWAYTRHPNYFGEVSLWWGNFLIALSVPYGWTAIISPLTITYLLVYVSGIPMNEQQFEDNPAYQEYKKQTCSFFPWFKKK